MALEGKGSKKTAKALNAVGLRTRDGKLFGTTIINYWLRNPVYTGVIAWNRTDRTRDKMLHKSQSEIICISDAHQPKLPRRKFYILTELIAGVGFEPTTFGFEMHMATNKARRIF
jgi:hypothetical protein